MPLDIVTGGAGFVGSHLVDRLLAIGRRVRVVDDLSVGRLSNLSQHKGNPQLEFIRADVSDIAAMIRHFEGADRVFHLAARADIVPSIIEPMAYFRSNVDGTFAVCEAARTHGVKRLIYAASSSCYGIPDQYPTPETAQIQPRYPYALTKYLGECVVIHWANTYRLPASSLRFFNVYGPRARTNGSYGAVFGVFLAQLLAGKPLTIVGDGTQTRDFTFVSDIVDAMVAVANSTVFGQIYNVGTGKAQSVNMLVELLGARETAHLPKRPGEPECTLADISRIRADLGWEPKISFDVGVKIMLDNIDYWREAPVWTSETITAATADWFKYLGENPEMIKSKS